MSTAPSRELSGQSTPGCCWALLCEENSHGGTETAGTIFCLTMRIISYCQSQIVGYNVRTCSLLAALISSSHCPGHPSRSWSCESEQSAAAEQSPPWLVDSLHGALWLVHDATTHSPGVWTPPERWIMTQDLLDKLWLRYVNWYWWYIFVRYSWDKLWKSICWYCV